MASFFNDTFSSHRFQLFATAVLSGATIASLLLAYQKLEREERLTELKNSIPSLPDQKHEVKKLNSFGAVTPADDEDARNKALAQRAQAGDFDEELILEQLARNLVFLKPEGLQKLRKSFVIVVGCGGVGSHCTTSLARSGASKIRLVDFDQVTLSSLNRHAVATLSDVGTPKVKCLERRLSAVAPWVKFDTRISMFDAKVASQLLGAWEDGQKPDYVVDAIDNIDTKVELLKFCYDHKIPVISSMGAACKSDPTRIVVGDISHTTDDRLSRATRRRLKLQGITSGIPAVFSTEKSGEDKAEILPLDEEEFQKGSVGDLGPMPNFRARILPVLGTMPAIFGLAVANHVILSISGYPADYSTARLRDKMIDTVMNFIQKTEEQLSRQSHPGLVGLKTPLTPTDISLLVDDIYRGRSIITGIPTRLVLIRWSKPERTNVMTIGEGSNTQHCSNVKFQDMVCMTKEEAVKHDKEVLKEGKKLEDVYDAETIAKVDARRAEAASYEKYR